MLMSIMGKRKKSLDLDIELTEEDIEVSLLELKKRVGPPLVTMKIRKRSYGKTETKQPQRDEGSKENSTRTRSWE